MRCWLTVHWPPLHGGAVRYPARVWVLDGREAVGRDLRTGDQVLIYETARGPDRLMRGTSGVKAPVRSSVGRQGIVAVAEAEGALEKDPHQEVFEYADGTKRWWCWHAPLTIRASDGFVPRSEVNQLLGFAAGYTFRGFGERSSGLKQLKPEAFESLRRAFEASRSGS